MQESERRSVYSSVTPNMRPNSTWKYNSNMQSTMKSRMQEPANLYIPGVSKYEPEGNLKKLLDHNTTLKEHTTKKWLKKKVVYEKVREPVYTAGQEANSAVKIPVICPQYLMSEQERKQDGIIAMIFAKFDTDGSGALDMEELVDLFKQNKIKLSRSTVKEMFQGDEFTLEKFKSIISSDQDLQRFKDVLKPQR